MNFSVRPARTQDVQAIRDLVEPYVQDRILLGKDAVAFYEGIQEFQVATDSEGKLIGCGAVHVLWEDLGEVRTLAVASEWLGKGVGRAIYAALEKRATELGLSRLFCLTFEVDFFTSQGFEIMTDDGIDPEVYAELVRSPDEGVAEFLDLARVKPITLGNTRMIKYL